MDEAEIDKRMLELRREFQAICASPGQLKRAVSGLFEVLVDEVILDVVFEVRRGAEAAAAASDDDGPSEDDEYQVVTAPDLDIFGQQPLKKSLECVCPNCERPVAALRFAPHLETCMGMGRNRGRNKTRRIVTSSKDRESAAAYAGVPSDAEDDGDWKTGDKKRRKKVRKNGIKKGKAVGSSSAATPAAVPAPAKKIGDSTDAADQTHYLSYDNMTDEEKKNLLTQICGVVSEHTKKICTRSLRCTQHSDEKKKALRSLLLPEGENVELANVDVEGDEDCDPNTFRDLLQDLSNTSSPADSVSTSNSSTSSSKRRDKKSKSSSKLSKKDRGSPSQFNSAE